MIKNKRDSVYLITHSYGEVIDGITYDEESAKYFVDKMNEKYKKYMKCFECRKDWFEKGEETIWICRNCGHVYKGKTALKVCPVCKHKESYMEVKAENY